MIFGPDKFINGSLQTLNDGSPPTAEDTQITEYRFLHGDDSIIRLATQTTADVDVVVNYMLDLAKDVTKMTLRESKLVHSIRGPQMVINCDPTKPNNWMRVPIEESIGTTFNTSPVNGQATFGQWQEFRELKYNVTLTPNPYIVERQKRAVKLIESLSETMKRIDFGSNNSLCDLYGIFRAITDRMDEVELDAASAQIKEMESLVQPLDSHVCPKWGMHYTQQVAPAYLYHQAWPRNTFRVRVTNLCEHAEPGAEL